MKKLALPLLLSSSVVFASDIVYYNQASLLSQSSTTKQVAQAINTRLSSQESGMLQLADKLTAQESQLAVYANKYASYDKMPKQKQKSFDAIYDSYNKNISSLASQYKQLLSQRELLNSYAAYKLGAMADGVASSYAKQHGIKAIYDYKQFRYVESSLDITSKLLPGFNAVDSSDLINSIKTYDLTDKSSDTN